MNIIQFKMQMEDEELTEIMQYLQKFLLLKQQNHKIYGWMQMKKLMKRMRSNYSASHRSMSKSKRQHSISSSHLRQQLQEVIVPHQEVILPYQEYMIPKVHTPKSIQSTPKYHLNPQQHEPHPYHNDLYATFSKIPINSKSSLKMQPFQHKDIDYSDSEEFQDLVLDRLSILEENVNRIMKEKKIKENQRGYVGAPISPFAATTKHLGKSYQLSKNNKLINLNSKSTSNIHVRKHDFMEQLQKSRQKSKSRTHQADFFQKLRNKIKKSKDAEDLEKEDRMQSKSYNIPANSHIRYIPFNNEAPAAVNIKKIREIVNRTAGHEGNNLQQQRRTYGEEHRNLQSFNKWNTNFRSYQNTKRLSQREKQPEPEDERLSHQDQNQNTKPQEQPETTEIINKNKKVNMVRTNANQYHLNQRHKVHFVPEHVEKMENVISALKEKKYSRNPTFTPKELNNSHISQYVPRNRQEGTSSNISRVSYQTAKLKSNNTFY